MRDPLLSDVLDTAVLDALEDAPAPAPNRAARRGKATDQVPAPARYRGSAWHARPAQGRRVNPIRRTG